MLGVGRQNQGTFAPMSNATDLLALLAVQQKPVCADLTPFKIIDADFDAGFVKLCFSEQPAFSNHWGHIQGGFGVSLLDVLISIAVFAKLRQWCPTVEIKSSFIAPARLGECVGEARVIKAGNSLVFVEAKLWGSDGVLAIHATATVSVRN
jgi:uncharacterized protein (TIGR00369 family)